MKIQIESYKRFPEGKVRGICSIGIDVMGATLTIVGVKVIDSPKGGHFYGLPSRKVVNSDTGDNEYKPINAFFIKGEYDVFHQAMNEAFATYFQRNPPPLNADPSGFGTVTSHGVVALPAVEPIPVREYGHPHNPCDVKWMAPPTTQTDDCPF